MYYHFTIHVEVDEYELDKLDDYIGMAEKSGADNPAWIVGLEFTRAARSLLGMEMALLSVSHTGDTRNIRIKEEHGDRGRDDR